MGELEIKRGELASNADLPAAANPGQFGWNSGAANPRPWISLSTMPSGLVEALRKADIIPQDLAIYAVGEPKMADLGESAGLRVIDTWMSGSDRLSKITFSETREGNWKFRASRNYFNAPATVRRRDFEPEPLTPSGSEPQSASGGSGRGLQEFGDASVLPAAVRRQLLALQPWTEYQAEIWRWADEFPTKAGSKFGYELFCRASGRGQSISLHAERFVSLPEGCIEPLANSLAESAPWRVTVVHGFLK